MPLNRTFSVRLNGNDKIWKGIWLEERVFWVSRNELMQEDIRWILLLINLAVIVWSERRFISNLDVDGYKSSWIIIGGNSLPEVDVELLEVWVFGLSEPARVAFITVDELKDAESDMVSIVSTSSSDVKSPELVELSSEGS
jgi:hypothetical protein